MIENPWRKLIFIVVLLVVSGLLLKLEGVKRGLDLKGGARLVYRLDIEKAKAEGQIPKNMPAKQILEETIAILYNRVDPKGVLDPTIQPQGTDRILIEIPGRKESEITSVRNRIQQLGKLEFRIVIDQTIKTFDIEAEKERLKKWLKNPENQKIIARNPDDISVFNSLPPEKGGPKRPGKIRWVPMDEKADPHPQEVRVPIKVKDEKGKTIEKLARFIPITLEEPYFKGEELNPGTIRQSQDEMGFPAVAFEFKEGVKAKFADFTQKHKKRSMAIILNGRCRSAPTIRSRIAGPGIITGGSKGFSPEEVRNLIVTLKTGALKVKPELESESTIGPTLGEAAIRIGKLSMLVGGIAVVLFMLLFYRMAGLIAVISLLVNMTYLMGAMALFRFTLTLPGLAGLVLTVGMAVDGNILIFERIREELDKGKVLVQAVKNGFQMALSTIVDANLTTLITAIILYHVGTGPIRGFAVTLSIGIITSMFAALVVSRVLFHLFHQFGILKELKMGRVFRNPNFQFLAKKNVAVTISLILVVAGISIFATTDPDTKLGIDFRGGASVRVTLKQPEDIDLIREKIVSKIPGAIVNTLGGTLGTVGGEELKHISGNKAQHFAVKFKLPEKMFREKGDVKKEIGQVYRDKLKSALAEYLISPPFSHIEVIPSPEKTYSIVSFQMHTEEPVLIEDIRKALKGFENLVVEPANKEDKGKKAVKDFKITMDLEAGVRKEDIPERIKPRLAHLKSVNGNPIALTEPFPEFEL